MRKMPRYEIHVRTHFSAAHHLRGYDGECSKPHGHNWTVDVFVRCGSLNDIGIGIDFRELKKAVADVVQALDHDDLNALPAFASENPSSENIAGFVYRELAEKLQLPGIELTKVRVSEGPTSGVTYWEG